MRLVELRKIRPDRLKDCGGLSESQVEALSEVKISLWRMTSPSTYSVSLDGQTAVDRDADAPFPAPHLGKLVGEVLRPGQPRAGQIGGGRVEAAVITRTCPNSHTYPLPGP